jgi:hypothetical protein
MRHVVFAFVFISTWVFAGEKLELADGERVVLLGNTFVEREVQYGSIETALTLAYKDKNITFRSVGACARGIRQRAGRLQESC